MSPRTEGPVLSEGFGISQQTARTDIVLELLTHPCRKRIHQSSELRVLNVPTVRRIGSNRAGMPLLILNLRTQYGT